MNLRRIAVRTAIAGVTTALGASALVGATGVAADAATVTNTYTCSLPGVYSGDFALTVTGDIPVPQYWAGAAVPKGLLNVTADATVPADAAGLLGAAGVTGAKSDDFGFALSDATVPVPLKGDFTTSGGTTTWHAEGVNEAFTTPDPGTYDSLMPTAFTMTTMQGDNPSVSLDCALADGQTAQAISTGFTLLKQSSATAAKPASAKKGKVAKLPVTVTSTSLGGPVTSGTVTVKEGKKLLGSGKLSKKGTVSISLGKKLKVGKHKVTVTYAGIPSVNGSSAKSTVTIKK